jgi:hypothetical protein
MRRTSLLFLAVGGAVGCTPYPTLKAPVPADCSAEDAYDVVPIDRFEMAGGPSPGWTSFDMTPGATTTATIEALTDGARCGSTAALLIAASGNNDWGSLFGFNNFGPRDASAFQGMSFWARAPGNTTKAFTILLDDTNTTNPNSTMCAVDAGAPPAPTDAGAACRNYCNDGGAGGPSPTYIDPLTGMVIGGATGDAPPADACGNSYATVVQVGFDWRFYTISFEKFHQAATPNQVPNATFTQTGPVPGTGLLTDRLVNLIFRMPKEAVMRLWIDNLGFYSKKAPGAVGDGGGDAQGSG